MEDGLKNILRKKSIGADILLPPYEKKIIEEEKYNLRKENKLMMEALERRKEIKEKIEKYRQEKREKLKKRKN